MTPRRVSTFRIDDELLEGMRQVWERDGVQVAEQVRRAIRDWLEKKGVGVQDGKRKPVALRRRL